MLIRLQMFREVVAARHCGRFANRKCEARLGCTLRCLKFSADNDTADLQRGPGRAQIMGDHGCASSQARQRRTVPGATRVGLL